jgi:hypothetical protein
MALLLGGMMAATLASPLHAQATATPLTFQDLRAAMSRAAADGVLARLGTRLSCRPTPEPRLQLCTAPAVLGTARVTVTITLVDGRVGIALIAGQLPAEQIATWHADLSNRYGAVEPSRRPGQESFQWIRAGQMLRLTVRRETGGLVASVSLVDGALLDGLPPP